MSDFVSKMLVRMSEICPMSLEWAWEGMVPMGMLTLLTGDPGVGKSLVSLQVASLVIRGVKTPLELSTRVADSMPEGEARSLSTGVIVLSAADRPEITVLPRLIAAGADASQVFFLKGHVVDEEPEEMDDETYPMARPFHLSQDLDKLEWCLEGLSAAGIDVGLIVIDSIDRYIDANEKKVIGSKSWRSWRTWRQIPMRRYW